MNDLVFWVAFSIVVVIMLVIDLGVLNRKPHAITVKEAFWTSLAWIGVALLFNASIFIWQDTQSGLEFFTGWLIEKALSVDNLFVFLVIFTYFRVDSKVQHTVLFWGIVGAIVLRGALIALGAALIHEFSWILYLFGAFLLYTAYKLATQKGEAVEPEKNAVLKFIRRFLPLSEAYSGKKFFVRLDGKTFLTPLMVVLLVVETTDLTFALDSIPAIFAITTDTFIVFTSNIFAVLGLRALYFLIAGVLGMFRYLKLGLSLVLGFVGVKMLIIAVGIKIPIAVSLSVVVTILAVSIIASMVAARRDVKMGAVIENGFLEKID